MPSEQEIRRTLDEIHDPCSVAQCVPMGLEEMGLVEKVDVDASGAVDIHLRLTSPFCEMLPFMKSEALERVGALEGVTRVEVHHDKGLDWDHDMIAPAAQERRQRRIKVLRERVEKERARSAARASESAPADSRV